MVEIDRIEDARIPELLELYRATWWAAERTADDVRTLVRHSDLVIGLVDEGSDRLVAFARVLTDRTCFAMIFDVIVAPGHRGTGLGRLLMERVLGRPELTAVGSIELVCQPDLVAFSEQFGFSTDVGTSLLMRRTSDPRLQSATHNETRPPTN